MAKLRKEFYLQEDVVSLACNLLGKKLCTNINEVYTAGIITETEAYAGITDKASHAYNNRRTKRTELMYHPGGVAYVYLCYGMHHMFNVVSNVKDVPHAILIRGIKPIDGIEHILARRKQKALAKNTSSGPGTLSQALGITTNFNGIDLTKSSIWIEDVGISFTKDQISITPRIGIDYAGEDAKLPYRFLVKDF
jgi:DNA-3-methyladenine glycosylase